MTRSAFCHFREKPADAMLERPMRFATSPASFIAAVAAFAIGRCNSVDEAFRDVSEAKAQRHALFAVQLIKLAL